MDRLRLDCAFKFDGSATDGSFSGYGAVFGNVDTYGDVIEGGAFKDTLRTWEDKGKYPPMLLQHGGGFLGGADDLLPVGKWTSMAENSRGLKVEGQLFALQTERGQYLYEGLKSGALDGLSIGYRAKEFVLGTKPGEPRRRL
ncbi:MAG: HK97 family phage prohead protease, partial [Reyranellaceae bacterium]